MEEKWKIVYYETEQGNSPASEFINNLDAQSKSKVINTIDLLKEFGIRTGLPHSKKLSGTVLWELRILGESNIRIIYVAIVQKTFLILHTFKKKKQKTDRREIKIAEERLRDYKMRALAI